MVSAQREVNLNWLLVQPEMLITRVAGVGRTQKPRKSSSASATEKTGASIGYNDAPYLIRS